MANEINELSNSVVAASVKAGEMFYVKFVLAKTIQKLAEVEDAGGSYKLTFKVDCLLAVEGLHPNGKTCRHLRFARQARKSGEIHSKVKVWPKLRVALHNWNEMGKEPRRFNVPGGLEYAIAYSDEMIVADYSVMGSNGWIVKRRNISRYLKALPPLEDSGETASVWVMLTRSAMWVNHERSEWPEVTGSDPVVHYRVNFDSGSLKILEILEEGEEPKEDLIYDEVPEMRWIEVGGRLPRCMRI